METPGFSETEVTLRGSRPLITYWIRGRVGSRSQNIKTFGNFLINAGFSVSNPERVYCAFGTGAKGAGEPSG
jgi:hypothetical protein